MRDGEDDVVQVLDRLESPDQVGDDRPLAERHEHLAREAFGAETGLNDGDQPEVSH